VKAAYRNAIAPYRFRKGKMEDTRAGWQPLQMSVGTLPHRDVMRSIELFGTEVAPAVRAATATQTANR
jgi:hypothetical protein